MTSPSVAFHVRLTCSACKSDTVVNIEGLSAKRAEHLKAALARAECGVCKKLSMHGEVRPGHSAEATVVVRDGPVTWDRSVIDQFLKQSRRKP